MWTGGPNRHRDIAALVVAIEQNRIEMQKAWERAENLDAAIESLKETHKKIKDRKSRNRGKI